MPQVAITDRSPQSPTYKRHRPEHPLLDQIIERYCPEFRDVMAMKGKSLPLHVQQEFADYLKCGCLEHGFIRVQCTHCHHEQLVAFSCKRRGFCPSCGEIRAHTTHCSLRWCLYIDCLPHVVATMAGRDVDAGGYQRHRPEQTLLYQIVDEYLPAFAALMAAQGR